MLIIPKLIVTAGGLGREGGFATAAALAYWENGQWPRGLFLLCFDAAEDTGRKTSGAYDQLPAAPPNHYFLELLPDTNLAAIGRAGEDPKFQQLFQVVPAEVLANGASDTASIGGYQRPGLGTAIFFLHYRQIDEALKAALAHLGTVAGTGRAEILTLAGGNGSIGNSFGSALARLLRERTRHRPLWRTTHFSLAIQPDGQTPDPEVGSAVFYTTLKDLALSAKRG